MNGVYLGKPGRNGLGFDDDGETYCCRSDVFLGRKPHEPFKQALKVRVPPDFVLLSRPGIPRREWLGGESETVPGGMLKYLQTKTPIVHGGYFRIHKRSCQILPYFDA